MLAAFISPYREDRERVRALLKDGQFIEVYVKCPISECEQRDPKGFYKKARTGEIKQFTGISAPYEEPENPQIILETDKMNIEKCVKQIYNYLTEKEYIYPSEISQENNP